MARRLVREEGLFCGGSSGSIVHGAVQIARELGEGKTVVTVLPDHGSRYVSKYLSDEWMRDYGFMEAGPDLGLIEDLLDGRRGRVITARADESVSELIRRFKDNGISQLPVVDEAGKPQGMVHEIDILRGLHDGQISPASPVQDVMHPIGGLVFPKARVEELFHIFDTDQVAVVVDEARVIGVVSQIDLIEYMSKIGRG